jgi:hypothetical protein
MGIAYPSRFPSAHYTDGRPRFAIEIWPEFLLVSGGSPELIDNLVLLHGNCHWQVHSQNLVVEKDRVP